MDPIEAIAFVLGVANVVLVVRRSIWNFPVALAMVVLYADVFLRAKLYSDALLQAFFFVVNLYGWVMWRHAAADEGRIVVETLRRAARWRWAIGCVVASALWGAGMHRYTDAAYPWWDGGIAIVSVAAQVMLAQRRIENWWLWIGVDGAAIGLYAAKGLWLTALLYLVFLGLAIWGAIDWRAVRRRQAHA